MATLMRGPPAPAVITKQPSRSDGPQVVEDTWQTITNAPPNPAPRPAVKKGRPMGSVTP